MGFSPEQEKALLSLIDREIALPALRHAAAITAARTALETAKAAEDAAKLGAAEVKP